MDSEKLINVAMMFKKVDETGEDEGDRLAAELENVNRREFGLIFLAYKLLSGRPYCVNSDDEGKYLEFAQTIGANFERTDSGLIFYPPARH